MADFTQSYVGGPQSSAITPQEPVTDNSNLVGLELLGNIASGVGNFASDFADRKREENKQAAIAALQAQSDQTISSFAQGQLRLAEATETGDISSMEARSRMRANLTRAIADNPALAVELGKAHTTLVKTTGLGQAVYEGTEQEKQQANLETKAVEAGWVRPDQTDSEKASAADAYVQFQRSIEMMEFESKKVGLQSAQIGLTTAGIQQQSARMTLAEKQRKQVSQVAVGQASGAYQVRLSNELEAIRKQKEAGTIDATQAIMMADQAYLAVDAITRQIGSQAGTEYISNVVAPMKMQLDNYKTYLSGDIALKDLNSRNDTTVAMQTHNMLGSPTAARLVATSKLFPNSDVITMSQANDEVLKFVQGGQDTKTKPADVLPDYEEGKQGLKTYLGMMTETMGKINSKSAVDQDQATEEVNNNLVNILKGIDVYGPTVSSTADYNGVMDFLSRTETGKFITKQGGFTDEGAAYKAGQALEFEYNNVVLPLIKQEYERTKAGGTAQITYVGRTEVPGIKGQKPTATLITPKFIGSGVVFNVNQGVTDSFTRSRAKELNEKVAPILNRIIRTSAHLSNTMDYKSVYEARFADLFNEEVKADDTGE